VPLVRPYEVVTIYNPGLENDEAYDAQIERFSTLVTEHGGEVVNIDKWGRRRLAYEINGLTEGYYVVMTFNAEPAVAAELERVLKITDTVVRHLVILLDEK
jgi:small subunit ribosomal protein S6